MPVNLEKILEHCRLCQLNPGTLHIVDNDEFIKQVFECTKVKINNDYMHLFPKTVCPSCKLRIEGFFTFAEEVRLVDQKLQSQFLKCNESEVDLQQHNKYSSDLLEADLINEHVKVNDSSRFKCPVCRKTYARYRNLELHKKGHTNLYCSSCELTFDNTASRKSHTCRVLKENIESVSCDDTDDVLLQNRIGFINTETEKTDFGTSDDQERKKALGLKKEWFEDEFPEDGEESCIKIKSEHKTSDELSVSGSNHEQLTEGRINKKKNVKDILPGPSLSCTYEKCSKVCTSAYSLRTHLMRHEGKMPFLCVTCGKGFTTKNSLNCHEKIHAKVKAYVCKECNIGFSVASNLRAHQKKHHEGVRFYCSQCTRAFITKCSLERHELVHTGIKEFKCETCQAEFYTNKELLKHQRYHQGLRLYKCEQCFKTFFEKHHLTIHIRVHTGERPYACKVAGCGRSFAESQKLSRHVKARHPSV